MIDYLLHRFDPNNFKVFMTLLVKNEADIIEQNIRTHAALGVDAFVVMDNDSTDGTYEILQRLAQEYDIHLIRETGLYNQAVWMRRLAMEAKRRGADWVINNDADEFWIPAGSQSIHDALAFKGSVLTVNRYNMILDPASQEKGFLHSIHRVENPVFYTKEKQLTDEDISMVLVKVGPKTIVNPHGLLLIRGGNHKAWHWANTREYLLHKYDQIKRFESISVYHYPFRRYDQFLKNILNRKNLLESGVHVKMGPHYRRWVRLYNEGKLEAEYQRLTFEPQEINTLKKFGILIEDSHPNTSIQRALGTTNTCN